MRADKNAKRDQHSTSHTACPYSGTMPTVDLRETFEAYLRNAPGGFVCPKAIEALERERVTYVEMPAYDTKPDKVELCREEFGKYPYFKLESREPVMFKLVEALKEFAEGKYDSVIVLQPGNPQNHIEGFNNCWHFYAMYVAAAIILDQEKTPSRLNFNVYIQRALDISEKFNTPETVHKYLEGGLVSLFDEGLSLMALNGLYEGHRKCPHSGDGDILMHSRFSPVTTYHIQRISDIEFVRENQPRLAHAISDRAAVDSGMLYTGFLPYIMPGDARFMKESDRLEFEQFFKRISKRVSISTSDALRAHANAAVLKKNGMSSADAFETLRREGLL